METNRCVEAKSNKTVARPSWAEEDALLSSYFDTEWGKAVRDEQPMFERLCLEGFQVGLSWRLILHKRQALNEAFAGFDPDKVSRMDSVEHLMSHPGLIRNRRKLQAVVTNAKATVALRDEGTHLGEFMWSYKPKHTSEYSTMQEQPTRSAESTQLARDLKRRGFTFVGPVNMYALMQSTGIISTKFTS